MRNKFKFLSILLIIFTQLGFKFGYGSKLCNPDKIFVTNDPLFKDDSFVKYEKLNDSPRYPGGLNSIQNFFDTNVSLTTQEIPHNGTRYDFTFIVNCNGELCKFELKSKKKVGYKKILEACKKMDRWIPARKENISVDCYVRLGFINQAGKLIVDYREK